MPTTPATYTEILTKLTSDKWQLVAEGPSGAQLKKPKPTSVLPFVLGLLLLLLWWPIGILILIAAVIQYAILTKEPTYFLSRDNPHMPGESVDGSTKVPSHISASGGLIILVVVAVVAGLIYFLVRQLK